MPRAYQNELFLWAFAACVKSDYPPGKVLAHRPQAAFFARKAWYTMNNTTITRTTAKANSTSKAKNRTTAAKTDTTTKKRTASRSKQGQKQKPQKETVKQLNAVKSALQGNRRGMLGTIPIEAKKHHNDTIPEGHYHAVISNAEDVTYAGLMDVIRIEITITDGEYKGRKMYRDIQDDESGLIFINSMFRYCTKKETPAVFTKDSIVGLSGLITVRSSFHFTTPEMAKGFDELYC